MELKTSVYNFMFLWKIEALLHKRMKLLLIYDQVVSTYGMVVTIIAWLLQHFVGVIRTSDMSCSFCYIKGQILVASGV